MYIAQRFEVTISFIDAHAERSLWKLLIQIVLDKRKKNAMQPTVATITSIRPSIHS